MEFYADKENQRYELNRFSRNRTPDTENSDVKSVAFDGNNLWVTSQSGVVVKIQVATGTVLGRYHQFPLIQGSDSQNSGEGFSPKWSRSTQRRSTISPLVSVISRTPARNDPRSEYHSLILEEVGAES